MIKSRSGHYEVTGSSSFAPPWSAPFYNGPHTTGGTHSHDFNETIPSGVWVWYWNWKEDKGIEEWTNGTVTHQRAQWLDHDYVVTVEQDQGEGEGGPG
ncbi:MAG: hypothetical protein ABL949_07495 [Fimbriimonadaceae bacterium]